MHLGDLAFELQLQVLQLYSRRDWTSLARVHSSLRDVAYYALYNHIRCTDNRVPSISFKRLMETLAENMQIASFVRVLEVEISSLNGYALPSLAIMVGMLPKMLNLYKLRISVNSRKCGNSGGINQVIRSGYFRLRVLCMEESQYPWEDIKGIIASQPDLRLLGFYRRNKIYKSLLTIAQKLDRDPPRLHPMPTIYMANFYQDAYHIILELLPSFHCPGKALEVFKEIEQCFHSYDGHRYILKLNLFGMSEKNIDLFREVMEAVGTRWPRSVQNLNIIVHQTSIQNLWRFPEFVKPLELFQYLEMLTFKFRYPLGATALHTLSTDMRLYLANSDLEVLCPELRNIEFRCKWNRDSRKLLHRRPKWLPLTY